MHQCFQAVGLELFNKFRQIHVRSFRMHGLSSQVAYSLSDCGQVFALAKSQQAGCKRVQAL